MSSTVKIIDKETGNILFECPIEQIEKAYEKAEEFEGFGLDIILKAPSLPETLIRSLGASEENVASLNSMLDEEIASHIEEDTGCSICAPTKLN